MRRFGSIRQTRTARTLFEKLLGSGCSVWGGDNLRLLGSESAERFVGIRNDPARLDNNVELRGALLDFIADFANWDNSVVPEYLQTSRALTAAAHEALGGIPGTRPLVVDPFAGGGSIPLEALRIGADAFASDLNPLPVLLNKVVLEYVPKYGQHLADEVRRWGEWIRKEAEKELADFYPKDPDGATPIAYLWARTIRCEGPGCGAEVPLVRSLWLAKKSNSSVALQFLPHPETKRVDFQIIIKQCDGWVSQNDPKERIDDPRFGGTVKRGSATCPCCGYTTPVARIREQLNKRHGGAHDSRLFCVVTVKPDQTGRSYRVPTNSDSEADSLVRKRLAEVEREKLNGLNAIPDEALPLMSGVFNAPIYGHNTWGSLFNPRQTLALVTIARLIGRCGEHLAEEHHSDLVAAVQTCLALALGRLADRCSNLCTWDPSPAASGILHVFSRQALPFVWDYAEGAPLERKSGGWLPGLEWIALVIERECSTGLIGATVERASATQHPLPDDAAQAVITDPPYYNAVPYADLSDFFYVWLRRCLTRSPELFIELLSPKVDECCEMAGWDPLRYPHKDGKWFERQLGKAMAESRRILQPTGIAVVVFAHKSTSGWEALLQALADAGWIITGSWPIDTEMGNRLRAMNSAALASSVHLVCRPRRNPEGVVSNDEVGDWRDVLQELPCRIHEWMPRLGHEGVVGADAIFACLGPALEIFSRYSHVEKASGETVTLGEYLEHVWAAVAKEALAMVFKGADASGFEEDARVTAIWLWTLFAGAGGDDDSEIDEAETAEEESETTTKAPKGYVLEYDTARKIAQGLGASLESLTSLVELKGEVARLLPVAERTHSLFGKDGGETLASGRKKKSPQFKLGFVAELEDAEESGKWGSKGAPSLGATVLDRVHQCMILFAASRGEALRRFLVDEGVGRDERFWRLAQVLSYLYPKSSDEKRWIDGVLARKKGLGF